MARAISIRLVADYFASKGRILSYEEYKNANDTPISAAELKRDHGSWTRVLQRVHKFFPDAVAAKAEAPAVVEAVVEKKVAKNDK